MISERSQSQKGKYCDSTYLRSLEWSQEETESSGRLVASDLEGRGVRSEWLVRTEFQFRKTEKVLEMDGGDGCTTVQMYLMPLNCTLKMINFMLYIFCRKKKRICNESFHLYKQKLL